MNLYTMTGKTVHRAGYAGSTRPLCREVSNLSKRFIPTEFKEVTCKSCIKKMAINQAAELKMLEEAYAENEARSAEVAPAPVFEECVGADGYTYKRLVGSARFFRVAPRR